MTKTTGTPTTGSATTASATTGTPTTGTATTGTATTETATNGTATNGTATTTTAPTGTAPTGTAPTGTATTGTGTTGIATTGTASDGAGGAAAALRTDWTQAAATDDPAWAETPSTGLGVPTTAGPIVSVPATGSPAGAAALPASTGPAVPVPLASQVARPLFTLAAAGAGEHTMSISVTPDDLGPVLVRAQISAAGIRLELFAPTDAARDALRLILPDLRRDLAGGALTASLDVSARSQPGDAGSSGRHDRPAADQFGQGNSALGGDPRGTPDRRRESADQWLRSPPIGTDAAAADAGADATRTDQTRGRVDVLA